VGRHDFGRFRPSDTRGKNLRSAICTVERVALRRAGHELTVTLTADRFLHHMVRRIVGLLVEIGKGRLPVESAAQLIADARRPEPPRLQIIAPTAPAHGLVLVEVSYPADLFKDVAEA
jgi:tRNA pseudouridine38-40 synthase